jgi:hypothetical protein
MRCVGVVSILEHTSAVRFGTEKDRFARRRSGKSETRRRDDGYIPASHHRIRGPRNDQHR